MSGLVRTRLALRRIIGRSADGVSPSYADALTPASANERMARSWSRARALVGER
jgi:hypothetical protein